MPLNTNKGGQTRSSEHKENRYLTEHWARHMYKKAELGDKININTIKQKIDQDGELNRLDDTNIDINPYRELIENNTEKVDTVLSLMEQWLILSNIVNDIKYNRHPKNFYSFNIKAMNRERYKRRSDIEEEKQVLELDFGDMQEKLKEDYLDIYKGIQSEIMSTTRFDEKSDLSTTYLGRVDMTRASKIEVEETCPISEQGYTR